MHDSAAAMTPTKTPRWVLLAFLVLYCGILGFGWLRQTPSQEELYGDVGRFLVEVTRMFRSDGIAWWGPDFLHGQSNAPYFLSAFPLFFGVLFHSIFGDPAGAKIAALVVLPASALTMFVFVRRLTGNEWTAMVAAILYVLNAQMILRIANFEHWMGCYSYIFPPLILWAFLKMAQEGSWRMSAWLAFGWSAMMLSYAKLTFVRAAGCSVLCLVADRPARAARGACEGDARIAHVGVSHVGCAAATALPGIPVGGGIQI